MGNSPQSTDAASVSATDVLRQHEPGQSLSTMSLLNEALMVAGRVLLSLVFIESGIGKIERYAQTGSVMQAHGVPGVLLPLVIALEVGGGAALALGALTRLTAAALAVYSVAAIITFLMPDPRTVTLRLVEFGMVGGLCAFAARGGGRISLDWAWARRQRKN